MLVGVAGHWRRLWQPTGLVRRPAGGFLVGALPDFHILAANGKTRHWL